MSRSGTLALLPASLSAILCSKILVSRHIHAHTCSILTGASCLRSPCVASPGAAECLLATMRNFPQKVLLKGKLERVKAT